ncbi:hypothetical protein B0H11DRAFT_2023742 [Mycena galericulata]|nr:hypothetical protein B0H11DRAFT_2023742 [Mycena galericulata]
MYRVGNTKRRCHGTSRKCCLGDDPHNLDLCNDSDCCVCQIIREGYEQSRARPSGLFGKGIYCTSTSSKAAKYSRTKKRSKYDVVFLNNIVFGKDYSSPQPLCNYTEPPAGYESVYGKAGYTSTNAGKTLEYDEICVYDDNAIWPIYLMYLIRQPGARLDSLRPISP